MKKAKKTTKKQKELDLSKYAGKWVAILGNKVVAHSENINEVAKYTVKDINDPTPAEKIPALFKVPRPDEGPYVLIICQ